MWVLLVAENVRWAKEEMFVFHAGPHSSPRSPEAMKQLSITEDSGETGLPVSEAAAAAALSWSTTWYPDRVMTVRRGR